jgi:hypothetical protein
MTKVTNVQRRNLADLLVNHGYMNVMEFYGELASDYPPCHLPDYDVAMPILDAWSRQVLDLADKSVTR